MKNILIIGDVNSIWIRDFAQYVIQPLGYNVYIYCQKDENKKFKEFYENNEINIAEDKHSDSILRRIPKIRGIFEVIDFEKTLRKITFFAAINIYVTPTSLKLLSSRALNRTKKYCIFIGSDVLRATNQKCVKMAEYLQKGNIYVICDSLKLLRAVDKRIIPINQKGHVIYFGTGNFEYMDQCWSDGISSAKSAIGVRNTNLITVCIGYNAIESQQHIKVIRILSQLSEQDKVRIVVLLPLAYGGTETYINEIEKQLQQSGLSYILLRDFLDAKGIATLRVATDVFLNTQTTDDLSASVLESLNAGCIILSGEWLDYPDLFENGINFNRLFSFENLRVELSSIINSPIQRKRVERNKLINFISWDECRKQWGRLMEESE